jgi:transcriptional regulator with XRE-family HTH domain
MLAVEQILKRLGQRIRELRIERGFTSQEKFADHCGVDRTFAGHLETGRRDFRLSTIIRIAEALNVPIAELFLEPGNVTAQTAPSERPKSNSVAQRRRILETAATLEAAARTLKQLAAPIETPKRSSKSNKDDSRRSVPPLGQAFLGNRRIRPKQRPKKTPPDHTMPGH